jgi:hypothetical protein
MVKHVGERYLWVDALCITQDDRTELGATLQLMHLIHGNAVFTICAMDGEDAASGLARLPRLLNQPQCSVIQPLFQGLATNSAE